MARRLSEIERRLKREFIPEHFKPVLIFLDKKPLAVAHIGKVRGITECRWVISRRNQRLTDHDAIAKDYNVVRDRIVGRASVIRVRDLMDGHDYEMPTWLFAQVGVQAELGDGGVQLMVAREHFTATPIEGWSPPPEQAELTI